MDFPNIPLNISCVVLSLNFNSHKESIESFMIDMVYWLQENPHCQTLVIYHDNERVNLNALKCLNKEISALELSMDVVVNPCLESHGVESFQEYFLAIQKYFEADAQYLWLLALSSPLMQEHQAIVDGYQVQLQQKSCQFILMDCLVGDDMSLASSDWSDDDSEQGAPLYLTRPNEPLFGLTAITPETTVLALALDFDGCTDTINARRRLSAYVCSILMTYPQITTVKFIIGSARQSLNLDFSNALTHGLKGRGDFQSCNVLGEQFAPELHEELKTLLGDAAPSVMFEPIMLCDALNHLEFGTTYRHLSQDFNRHWGSVTAAFYAAEFLGGLYLLLLSNHVPGRRLRQNHWHLSYRENQFSVHIPGSHLPIRIPPELSDSMQELLERHGFWLNGHWPEPVVLVKTDHAICLQQLLEICKMAATVEVRVENLDGVQLPIFRVAAADYDAADSITMFDELKTSLLFLWAHWLGRDATQPCALLMLDDRDQDEVIQRGCLLGILDSLTKFYSRNGDLLPSNLRLQCVPFDARDADDFTMPQAKTVIQGQGRLLSTEECRQLLQKMARTIPAGSPDAVYKACLRRYVNELSEAASLNPLPTSTNQAGLASPPVSIVNTGVSTLAVLPSSAAVLGETGSQRCTADV